MPIQSKIYYGKVLHQREWPKKHSFNYSLFYLYLDLDELPELFTRTPFFSLERFNLASFRRKDYFGDPKMDLKKEVQRKVYEKTGLHLSGPIRLLTHMRYFGLCFNPVSFYFCFDSDGTTLRAIMAEIENTPWKERHSYFFSFNEDEGKKKGFEFSKEFHVSPFFDMNLKYKWFFHPPSDNLQIHMELFSPEYKEGNNRVFQANLSLKEKEWSSKGLSKALFKFPFLSFKVVLGIYIQAFKLFLKKVPFYSHPDRSKQKKSFLPLNKKENPND